jgi:hypothetical protein
MQLCDRDEKPAADHDRRELSRAGCLVCALARDAEQPRSLGNRDREPFILRYGVCVHAVDRNYISVRPRASHGGARLTATLAGFLLRFALLDLTDLVVDRFDHQRLNRHIARGGGHLQPSVQFAVDVVLQVHRHARSIVGIRHGAERYGALNLLVRLHGEQGPQGDSLNRMPSAAEIAIG